MINNVDAKTASNTKDLEQSNNKVIVQEIGSERKSGDPSSHRLRQGGANLLDGSIGYDPYEESEYIETEFEMDSRKRSKQNKCYRCTYLLVTSVSFNFFIFVLILANTATLAVYRYDESETQIFVLKVFNEIFTWTFFLEMVLKIIGLGFKNYRQDSFNVFDAVIVDISLVDWTITVLDVDAGGALKAFRAMRLLRMMKLSKSWKAL